MPLARIYASSVEEAEPLSADLFARGYIVEVVFPDAELPTPADLELRLEHCSPAQAIARVEAGSGSPARCVFLTSTSNPQQDLILIEMTVAATGTDSRHPRHVPVNLLGANLAVAGAAAQVEETAEEIRPTRVIVMPVSVNETVVASGLAAIRTNGRVPSKDAKNGNDDDWHKLVSAEVTTFLAHAPRVEPIKVVPVKILHGIRHSRIAERVRNLWEVLALLGMVLSILMVLYIGWQGGPSGPTVDTMHSAASTKLGTSATRLPVVAVPAPTLRLAAAAPRVPNAGLRSGDHLIARDTVVRFGGPTRKALRSQPIPAADKILISRATIGRTSPVQTSSVQITPVQTRPKAIKKITDLK